MESGKAAAVNWIVKISAPSQQPVSCCDGMWKKTTVSHLSFSQRLEVLACNRSLSFWTPVTLSMQLGTLGSTALLLNQRIRKKEPAPNLVFYSSRHCSIFKVLKTCSLWNVCLKAYCKSHCNCVFLKEGRKKSSFHLASFVNAASHWRLRHWIIISVTESCKVYLLKCSTLFSKCFTQLFFEI